MLDLVVMRYTASASDQRLIQFPSLSQPQAKAPKWYAGDDIKAKPAPQKHNPTKLRSSLIPGTVLILLSGRFRGKRVVFLKQLPSGTLLVTGERHSILSCTLRLLLILRILIILQFYYVEAFATTRKLVAR